MPATCVVGLQWGDEAKGKIVDLLSDEHDFVVRYNGGANAGHTIVWGERTFKLSLLPTGILKPQVQSVIGNGLVIYPPRFREEIELLKQNGVEVRGNLSISERAHIIFPYHMEEERLLEQGSAEAAIGTTGRGIGPCYQDKVGRRFAIRVVDLLDRIQLQERLSCIVPHKNRLLCALATNANPAKQFNVAQLTEEYASYGELLRPYVANTTTMLQDAAQAGKKILFEAAQGSLLDVDHGSYPYVTSSSSLPSGIWTGSGFSSRKLSRVIGIVKAYSTRVGRGPFPTELNDGDEGIGERIRRVGREFGTVTGRPRRTGWLDMVALKYTASLADIDEFTLMLLDVLSGLPELKLCVAYEYQAERLSHFPAEASVLEQCKPIYETLSGWEEDITTCRKPSDLPIAARRYVERVAELLGKPVSMVSVGPDRDQTLRMT